MVLRSTKLEDRSHESPQVRSTLAELSRESLYRYAKDWRKLVYSIQRSDWFKELCEQSELRLEPIRFGAFTVKRNRFVLEVRPSLYEMKNKSLNRWQVMLNCLLDGQDLPGLIAAVSKRARNYGIKVPSLELPRQPKICVSKVPVSVDSTLANSSFGRDNHAHQIERVQLRQSSPRDGKASWFFPDIVLSDGMYTPSHYASTPSCYFADKRLARALVDHVGGLHNPNWIAMGIDRSEMERKAIPLAEVVKQLDFVDIFRRAKDTDKLAISLGSMAIIIYRDLTLFVGKARMEIGSPYQKEDEMQKVKCETEEELKQQLQMLANERFGEEKVLLSPKRGEITLVDFPEKALALGQTVYFKPYLHGLQGSDIFTVHRNTQGTYVLATNSDNVARTILKVADIHRIGHVGFRERVNYRSMQIIERMYCEALNQMGIRRSPFGHLKITFRSKDELLEALEHFQLERYFAEEEIPHAKVNNRSIEFGQLFLPQGREFKLKGHFASLASSSITGHAAGSDKKVETYEAFGRLIETHPKCSESAEALAQKFFKHTLSYLSRSVHQIDTFGKLDSRLIRLHASKYQRPDLDIRYIRVDTVAVWNEEQRTFLPFMVETNAINFEQVHIGMATRGLWSTRRELFRNIHSS